MSVQCPKCQTQFEQGAKFCQSCGLNIESAIIKTPTCPVCKTDFPIGTNFCIHDGTALTQPQVFIYKCSVCSAVYPKTSRFCPIDGGAIKATASMLQAPSFYTTKNDAHGNAQSPHANSPASLLALSNQYPKADLSKRFWASVLDSLITMGLALPSLIFFGLAAFSSINYSKEEEVMLCLFFGTILYLMPLTYALMKDGLEGGQSWGKKKLGLMVVNLNDNNPCSKGKSLLRNITLVLCSIVMPFIGGFVEPILVLMRPDGRRLGDIIAKTQVIEKSS